MGKMWKYSRCPSAGEWTVCRAFRQWNPFSWEELNYGAIKSPRGNRVPYYKKWANLKCLHTGWFHPCGILNRVIVLRQLKTSGC
jgi:hypothetical protein